MQWWPQLDYYDKYMIILLIILTISWIFCGTWAGLIELILSDFSLTGIFVISIFLAIISIYHITKRLYNKIVSYFYILRK